MYALMGVWIIVFVALIPPIQGSVWRIFRDSEYLIKDQRITFDSARSDCQEEGGDLAILDNLEINLFLQEYLSSFNLFWFGLRRQRQERHEWIDGRDSSFTRWMTETEPNNVDSCGAIARGSGLWYDDPCDRVFPYICERKREPGLPIYLTAVSTTPFGGGQPNNNILCLLSPPYNTSTTTTTAQRLVRQDSTQSTYLVPGTNSAMSQSVPVNQILPTDNTAAGFYHCSSYVGRRRSSVYLPVLLSERQFQPTRGRFTHTAQEGQSVELSVTATSTYTAGSSQIRWRSMTSFTDAISESEGSLTHMIASVMKSDIDVYATYQNGNLNDHQYSLIRLNVKECPDGKWEPPRCDRSCDACYNGGVCHEESGTCICPPGFSGEKCLSACGENTFGWSCEIRCGPGQTVNVCAGIQICLPDPYGCNCLSGYTGVDCSESCASGTFGVDCLQECRCADGEACDAYTGSCPGQCLEGWSGAGCQVPIVCPSTYFGADCGEPCNCLSGSDCDQTTGYCSETEGRCQVGYIADSSMTPDACSTYAGCYDSCSNTCHCSGGADDCDRTTGACSSGTCHPRWMGDRCQTDRFQVSTEKTNPGSAHVSCAVSGRSGQTLASGDIMFAINDFSGPSIRQSTASALDGGILNDTFSSDNILEDDVIYCFLGNPEVDSTFAFARLPARSYFRLPVLSATPEALAVGMTFLTISWRQWNSDSDEGDGPLVAYNVYIRAANDMGERVLTLNSSESVGANRRRKRADINGSQNATLNITGLEAGTVYIIQVSASREGPNGEGIRGEELVVSTTPDIQQLSSQSAVGGAVGAVVAILGLLILAVLVVLFLRRRRLKMQDQSPKLDGKLPHPNQYDVSESDGSANNTDPTSSRRKPPIVPSEPSPAGSPTKPSKPTSKKGSRVTRRPIPAADYPAFVHKNRHTSLFADEYLDLPEPDIFPQISARKEVNYHKNRYRNILPYESTRVKLEIENNDPDSDYYNASYISSFDQDKAYIASQGPNKASVNDFWRMVWQEDVRTIAMVTKLNEGGKVKCLQYWPAKDKVPMYFGNIRVELVFTEPCTGGVQRVIEMRKDDRSKQLRQFHYMEWPDKGVPKHMSSLLRFIKEVKANHSQNSNAPLLIHCSAGVGRTGVVIGIDSIVRHAKITRTVDVFGFVSSMREMRPFMVQTQEQYMFLYGAVLEDLLWKNTSIPVVHFSDHLSHILSSGNGKDQRQLSKEFETLKRLCPDPPASLTRSGRTRENRSKNRYGNILPVERNRVLLQSSVNDYINASFVQGAHIKFITTQTPLPGTVSDFLSMILDNKLSCIVMLQDKQQQDKSCAQYWSDDGSATFEPYTVTTLSLSQHEDVITRTLQITSQKSQANHVVTQHQFLSCPRRVSGRSTHVGPLLKLLRDVRKSTEQKDGPPLLVHCLSGVGLTGVFCTALECIAQVADSDTIDIFQTVKMLRADRVHLVETEEEYALIYDILQEYLKTNDYEQLPYPKEEHTYTNNTLFRKAAHEDEEGHYEITQPGPIGNHGNGPIYDNMKLRGVAATPDGMYANCSPLP